MSALRSSHAIWLMRRAAILEGTAADAGDESRDPVRAAVLHQVASKVSRAVADADTLALTPEERTALVIDVHVLAERAAADLRRGPPRDLGRSEEWLRIARALREVLEASPASPGSEPSK